MLGRAGNRTKNWGGGSWRDTEWCQLKYVRIDYEATAAKLSEVSLFCLC